MVYNRGGIQSSLSSRAGGWDQRTHARAGAAGFTAVSFLLPDQDLLGAGADVKSQSLHVHLVGVHPRLPVRLSHRQPSQRTRHALPGGTCTFAWWDEIFDRTLLSSPPPPHAAAAAAAAAAPPPPPPPPPLPCPVSCSVHPTSCP
eukprot:756778-Hanusia_phi.AAC.6